MVGGSLVSGFGSRRAGHTASMDREEPSEAWRLGRRLDDQAGRSDGHALIIAALLVVLALAFPLTRVEATSADLPGPEHGDLSIFETIGLAYDLDDVNMYSGSEYGDGSGSEADGGAVYSLLLGLLLIGSLLTLPALVAALMLHLAGRRHSTLQRRVTLAVLYGAAVLVKVATLMSGSTGESTGPSSGSGEVTLSFGSGVGWWMLVLLILQIHLAPNDLDAVHESSSSRHERT